MRYVVPLNTLVYNINRKCIALEPCKALSMQIQEATASEYNNK